MLKTIATVALTELQESNEVSNYAYSSAQALISRQLSADAYCGYSKYASHVFEGAAAGFVVTKTLYDKPTDTEGYVGYLPSDNSIYVVFRGSSSIKNWISNLEFTVANYRKWPDCGCFVHAGF
jgi:hypothetical protein